MVSTLLRYKSPFTSNATNMRTALTGVISGSHCELLAAIPNNAQFVITAIKPIPSNTNYNQKDDILI